MFFLELSCFFNDPAGVGNLISDSSAFSKTSLNIWKFMVYVLLKPGLENFEHYFTSMWDEYNCVVVRAFLALPFFFFFFFEIGMKTDLFQSCGHCWVFQICRHIECSAFTASSFRIWNSSTGIPTLKWSKKQYLQHFRVESWQTQKKMCSESQRKRLVKKRKTLFQSNTELP